MDRATADPCDTDRVSDDRVDQLRAASGLPVVSMTAARTAWDELVARGRARWPGVRLDEPVLAAFIGERLDGDELATALAAMPGPDLALAAACATGEPTALAAFEHVLAEVEIAGTATGSPPDLVEEVKQQLRVQLLVGHDGKPPGIAGFRGRGPLRGWIRITASRELIRHKKKQARERLLPPDDGELDPLLSSLIDPALEALKAEYRVELAGALRQAIADLSAEDRALLRQHVVDKLSIDDLGAAFGVHRATAARWLQRARSGLVNATHRRLAEQLALPIDEMASVIRLVRSQLDASVIRYLRDADQ